MCCFSFILSQSISLHTLCSKALSGPRSRAARPLRKHRGGGGATASGSHPCGDYLPSLPGKGGGAGGQGTELASGGLDLLEG